MEGDRLLVFSPHLDDAVLSLGSMIATHPGSVVVTVLAGMPGDETIMTEWDTSCGFDNAGDSMRARWDEDRAALAELSATSIHLGFLDRQYGDADRRTISNEIARIVSEHPGRPVYGPFGLVHPDHILVSDAFLDAMATTDGIDGHLYAEIPYYAYGGSFERRRVELEERDVAVAALVEVTDEHAAKVRARQKYASQMGAISVMPLDLPEVTAAVRCTTRR